MRKGKGEPGNEAISIMAKHISSTAFTYYESFGWGGGGLQPQIILSLPSPSVPVLCIILSKLIGLSLFTVVLVLALNYLDKMNIAIIIYLQV